MSQTKEQYRQAWQGWWRWPPFRALAIVAAVEGLLLWIDVQGIFYNYRTPIWLDLVLVPTIFAVQILQPLLMAAIPAMLVWRVRQQMLEWRSALMPDFRRAHLMAAAALAGEIFLLLVVVSAAPQISQAIKSFVIFHELKPEYVVGWVFYPFGGMAQILFVAVLSGWIAARASPWLAMLLVFVPMMFFGGGAGSGAIRYLADAILLNTEIDPLSVAGLWFCDACWIAALALQLARISPADRGPLAREKATWFGDFLVSFRRLPAGGLISAGLWRRGGHRRMIGLGRRFCLLLAIYIAAVVGFSRLVEPSSFVRLATRDWRDEKGYAFAALVVAAITGAVTVGLLWPHRLAALREVELLRPSRRDEFVREIGLAMLRDMAEVSLGSIGLMLAPIAFWSPAAMHTGVFWAAVLAAVLSQALVFGAIVWTMRSGWSAISLFSLTLAISVTAILINEALNDRRLMPSLFAAAIGVALAAAAYRRWLRIDML